MVQTTSEDSKEMKQNDPNKQTNKQMEKLGLHPSDKSTKGLRSAKVEDAEPGMGGISVESPGPALPLAASACPSV